MKRLIQTVAFVAMVFPSSAFSVTIDQSYDFSGFSAFSGDVFSTFNQYDGPEALTGVSVLYSYASSGAASADLCQFYGDCEPATAVISLEGSGAFAGLTASDTDNTGITNATDAEQNGTFSVSIGGTFSPLDFALFVGTGLVGGAIETGGQYNAFARITGASHAGNVTLRYTTTPLPAPVPLPASLGMLLVGASGLGLTAMRKRSQKA